MGDMGAKWLCLVGSCRLDTWMSAGIPTVTAGVEMRKHKKPLSQAVVHRKHYMAWSDGQYAKPCCCHVDSQANVQAAHLFTQSSLCPKGRAALSSSQAKKESWELIRARPNWHKCTFKSFNTPKCDKQASAKVWDHMKSNLKGTSWQLTDRCLGWCRYVHALFMRVPRRLEASVPSITLQSVEANSEQRTQFQAWYDRLRSTAILV